MVDRAARRKYAELVRQFISGRMTNDEYESKFEVLELLGRDRAVIEIHSQVWFLYDDMTTHKMEGAHRLDKIGRRRIAQAVLFLQSGSEYNWPTTGVWGCLLFPLPLYGLIALALACSCPTHLTQILSATVCLCAATAAFALFKGSQEYHRWETAGDTEAWPFRTEANLAEAKLRPQLLAGRQ